MNKKKSTNTDGIIYSTNPDFKPAADDANDDVELSPNEQKLKVRLDKKQRAGKAVTLIEGFSGPEALLEELGKKLKSYCGVGGSVKDGQVLIQGDQRDKILQWLLNNGYKQSKKI